MEQGYITVATRRPKHLEMAVDLALSIRQFDPKRKVSVLVDRSNRELLERLYPTVFDHVAVVPDEYAFGHAPKLYVGESTPFESTLFVDADCVFLSGLDELWERLAEHQFSIMGESVDPSDHHKHHNISTRHLAEKFQLDRYFHASSPIFYFRKQEGRRILRACMDLYAGPLNTVRYWRWDTACAGDELAFSIVGSREEIGRWPGFHAMLKRQHRDSWNPGEAPYPIFHCTFGPKPEVMDWVIETIHQRRNDAGLPLRSEKYWRGKARIKKMQHTADRMFGLRPAPAQVTPMQRETSCPK